MLLQGQHTLPEVLAVVDSQDKAISARYSTNADTAQNKLNIKAEQTFTKALSDFIKAVTKGFKGVPSGGLILDYDVTPHSVVIRNLQFSASESRDEVNQGVKAKKTKKPSKPKTPKPTPEPKSRSTGASPSGVARSGTASSDSNTDK